MPDREISADVDLFGDPIPAGFGKRGRPPHVPTERNRNKVMLLLGVGWTPQRIARSLGVTMPTLRKHYFSELRHREAMLDRMKAGHLASLWEQMKAGNVAAAKEIGRILDRTDAALFGLGSDGDDEEAEEEDRVPIRRMGKKEQAQADAATAGAGTEWGDDLLPPGRTAH